MNAEQIKNLQQPQRLYSWSDLSALPKEQRPSRDCLSTSCARGSTTDLRDEEMASVQWGWAPRTFPDYTILNIEWEMTWK